MSEIPSIRPERRRRAFAPVVGLRAERLQYAITIAELSIAAQVNSYKISRIERGIEDSSPEELALLRAAIAQLAEERKA